MPGRAGGQRVPLTGSTVYTCMLNKRGGVESDLTVSRISPGDPSSPLAPAFQGKPWAWGNGVCASSLSQACSCILRMLLALRMGSHSDGLSTGLSVLAVLRTMCGRGRSADCIYLMAATCFFPLPPLAVYNPIIPFVPGACAAHRCYWVSSGQDGALTSPKALISCHKGELKGSRAANPGGRNGIREQLGRRAPNWAAAPLAALCCAVVWHSGIPDPFIPVLRGSVVMGSGWQSCRV